MLLLMKQCSMCKEHLPLEMYYRQHRTGHYAACKQCCNIRSNLEYRKKKAYYLQLSKAWKRTPKGKAIGHTNYLRRKAKGLTHLCGVRFRANSKEKNAAIQKRYKQSAKGKAGRRRDEAKRRMAKRNKATLTHKEWIDILTSYRHRCAYCGSTKQLTQDHYFPLAKGGEHTLQNVVPACLPCNQKKQVRHPHTLF